MPITLNDACETIVECKPVKLILSKQTSKNTPYKKVVIEDKMDYYQISQYTEKQVFHISVSKDELLTYLTDHLVIEFQQCNAFTISEELILLLSKKGTVTLKRKKLSSPCVAAPSKSHNREKNYLIREGTIVPPLIDMGIFTKDGKVVRSMYDKYRQINRFIELINDTISSLPDKETFHIIDFGCGKSYLTFILYYYFTEMKHMNVSITGLDLKEDVIKKCNEAAKRYHYEKLHFELGDINGYHTDSPIDMVVTLHACDTATDYALMNAIEWNASIIFSVPCCQHEWNQQMNSSNLEILSRYGIIQERFSALATDAVRANLLECCSYKTQLLEFVDFENTPKNLLIRAIRKPIRNRKTKELEEVKKLIETFHVEPTFYKLLKEKGYIE